MTKHHRVSLLFLAILSFGVAAAPATDPAAMVREFYERHPRELRGGLPEGADLEWLAGWISTDLHSHFRETLEYQDEWIKRNGNDGNLKPPFGDGVPFTGVPDVIDGFEVRAAESFGEDEWQVPVHFCIGAETTWDARVVVRQERSRYVIDDIVFYPMYAGGQAWTLSAILDSREDE